MVGTVTSVLIDCDRIWTEWSKKNSQSSKNCPTGRIPGLFLACALILNYFSALSKTVDVSQLQNKLYLKNVQTFCFLGNFFLQNVLVMILFTLSSIYLLF